MADARSTPPEGDSSNESISEQHGGKPAPEKLENDSWLLDAADDEQSADAPNADNQPDEQQAPADGQQGDDQADAQSPAPAEQPSGEESAEGATPAEESAAPPPQPNPGQQRRGHVEPSAPTPPAGRNQAPDTRNAFKLGQSEEPPQMEWRPIGAPRSAKEIAAELSWPPMEDRPERSRTLYILLGTVFALLVVIILVLLLLISRVKNQNLAGGHLRRAQVAIHQGQLTEARNSIQDAADIVGTSAAVTGYAMVYKGLSDFQEALNGATEALDEERTDDAAKQITAARQHLQQVEKLIANRREALNVEEPETLLETYQQALQSAQQRLEQSGADETTPETDDAEAEASATEPDAAPETPAD